MENQPNFSLKLSLEEMALRRAVVNLWNTADILSRIEESRFEVRFDDYDEDWRDNLEGKITSGEEWPTTIEKVKAEVSELLLPESLKKRMLDIVRPIGAEMLRWRSLFYETYLIDSREESKIPMKEICWTSAGAVDYRKTEEKLICLETLDVVKRFRSACLYCLEDHISILWGELPEEYKSCFNDLDDEYLIDITCLEIYWAHVLKGENSKLHDFVSREFDNVSSMPKWAFGISASEGEKTATEYFFQKLTREERDSVLFRTACVVTEWGCEGLIPYEIPKHKYSDVLCYLLSVMSPSEKMQILNTRPGKILRCLLNWPWQDLFLDTADIIWTFLPESRYYFVLDEISKKIRRTGYYIPKILQEFFLRSPRNLKKLLAIHFNSFFSPYSCVPDTETLEVIFRNVDVGDRVEVVSSREFGYLFYVFIMRDEWHIVEVLVRETLLSKEDVENFKEASGRMLESIGERDTVTGTRRLEQFLELLDRTPAGTYKID